MKCAVAALLVSLTYLILPACTDSDSLESHVDEAPDRYNTPEKLGLEGGVTWEDIKDVRTARLATRWMGSGLAIANQSLAGRWLRGLEGVGKEFLKKETLEEFLSSWIDADQNQRYALSPAEKYDMLMHNLSSLATATEAERQRLRTLYEQQYENHVRDIAERKHLLEERLFVEIPQRLHEANEAYSKKFAELGEAELSGIQERIDALRAEVDAIKGEILKLQTEMSLSWPELDKLHGALQEAYRGLHGESKSLAQMMSSDAPTVAQAWQRYLELAASGRKNWGWFGHCHGAAAAALYEPRPLNAVLATHGDREVMFFQDDIRSIFVKAWADQADTRGKFFAGRRCYHSDIEKGESGRPIDGAVCSDTSTSSCTVASGGQEIFIVDNQISQTGSITFKVGDAEAIATASVVRKLARDTYLVDAALAEGQESERLVLSVRSMCRDVNPMTFHLALSHLVARGTGIIIDGSSDQSVWNFPVGSFEIDYPSVQLKNGDHSIPGELVDIDALDDKFAQFRAKDTHYIVPVQAKIGIPADSRDGLSYGEQRQNQDKYQLTYTYTLEFDRERQLIGGEWGDLVNSESEVYNGTPDFIWFLPKSAELKDGLIDLEFIKKLRGCARSPQTEMLSLSLRQDMYGKSGSTENADEYVDVEVPFARCAFEN